MKMFYLATLSALFLVGCVNSAFFVNVSDTSAFSKVIRAGDNLIGEGFELNPIASVINKRASYNFDGAYKTTCENALGGINEIEIALDDEKLTYKNLMTGHICYEDTKNSRDGLFIEISNEDFGKIISSKKIDVALIGNVKTINYEANETFKQNLKIFNQRVEENLK